MSDNDLWPNVEEFVEEFREKIKKIYNSPDVEQYFYGKFETSDCLHDNCSKCQGTGIKKLCGICVHGISCPCPKCTPR